VSATRPVGELREQASALIIQKLKTISAAQAARDLGVTRQAVYGFKSGEFCPSLAVIQRACKAWELQFNVNGMTISAESFKTGSKPTPAPVSAQLTFFDLWTQLQDQKMTVVRARRIDGAVEMTLRISMPA
jgi:DNA-binding XRE family transcriptional regulator